MNAAKSTYSIRTFTRALAILAWCAVIGALVPGASAQTTWDLLSVSNTNTLMRVDLSSGPSYTATAIGVTQDAGGGPIRRIRGLALAGSVLYGMTREGDLVTVNPNNGETTFILSVATSGVQWWSDLAYDAVNNDLYTVNAFGDHSLVKIDLDGFTDTVQGPTGFLQMLGCEFIGGMLVAANRSNNNIVEMDPTTGSFTFTWGPASCGVANIQQIAVHPGTGVLWGIHDGTSNNARLSTFDTVFQATVMGELPFGIIETLGGGMDTYGWGGIVFIPAPCEVITLQSGDPTIRRHPTTVSGGPLSPLPFTDAAWFLPAQGGPAAFVITPFSPPWLPTLPCCESASWINHAPTWTAGSVLYAMPFTVQSECIQDATISLCWAVDNALGDQLFGGPNPSGLYVNGIPTSIDGGSFGSQTFAGPVNISSLVDPGPNWLYLYQRNVSGPAGLIFCAQIDITCCPCLEVVEEEVICLPDDGSGMTCFTYNLTLTNQSQQDVCTVKLVPPSGSPLTFTPSNLPVTLPPGGTTSISVTGCVPAGPPTVWPFKISLHDCSGDVCCAIDHEINVDCDCLQLLDAELTCNPDGTFTLNGSLQNLFPGVPISHIFFHNQPPALMFSPDYVPLSTPLPEDGVTALPPIVISGTDAVPGTTICFDIGIHIEDLTLCCLQEVCIPAPLCDLEGACCLGDLCFLIVDPLECEAFGGVFLGPGTSCDECGPSPACPGDCDGDGAVGFADLLILLSEWGLSGAQSDLDGDGTVGLTDLLQVLFAWGPC